ncbi:MAG: hypothetical protein Q7T76_16125 [Ferruginibacter sp.]|nr:hypothetical protein [Ferruginibacter sp.]
MKKLFNLGVFLMTASCVGAQVSTLDDFEKKRIRIDKTGMLTLAGWSAANLAIGAIGTNSSNREHKYFHQMNLTWGAVNLLVAGLGFHGSKEIVVGVNLSDVLLHQNKKEKIFLLNAGLDVAYITGGLYLRERSRRNVDPAKLKGYGNSVILQGGFLLLFDAVMYSVHHTHGKQLRGFTDKVSLSGTPAGMALVYRL